MRRRKVWGNDNHRLVCETCSPRPRLAPLHLGLCVPIVRARGRGRCLLQVYAIKTKKKKRVTMSYL